MTIILAVPLPRDGEAGPGTSAGRAGTVSRAERGTSAAEDRAMADTLGQPSDDRPASPERGMARPS